MAVNSIFFIDDQVQDKEALFSTIDASAKWFVLDSSLDGINQIQRILSSYRDLDSIQIPFRGVPSIFKARCASNLNPPVI